MTDFIQTAELVRRHVERFRDLIALGDALAQIGQLDHTAAEHQAELDRVIAELETAHTDLATVKAEHEEFLANRDADLAQHKTQADQIVADAELKAAMTVNSAEATAKGVADAATAEAERVQAAHAVEMARANDALRTAHDELECVRGDIAAAEAERDRLAAVIQNMKDMARSALGPA